MGFRLLSYCWTEVIAFTDMSYIYTHIYRLLSHYWTAVIAFTDMSYIYTHIYRLLSHCWTAVIAFAVMFWEKKIYPVGVIIIP